MTRSRLPGKPDLVFTVQGELTRAFALHQRGQLAEAEQTYRAILKSQPRHFDAAFLLGLLFLRRGDTELAERQLRRALAFAPDPVKTPNLAEACHWHGLALARLGRFEEAQGSFSRAIALKPDHHAAIADKGATLHHLGRYDQALALQEEAIALRPQFVNAYQNRGTTLHALGRFDEAIASFDKAIALKPDFHDAFYSRGLTRILTGDYRDGWRDAEHRLRTEAFQGVPPPSVAPTREAIKGKRLLVAQEQGAGDEIMFASMIPDLVRDTKNVTLECDRRLLRLFARSFPGVGLVAKVRPPIWNESDFDCVLPVGSLGALYRNRAEDFPERDSYLMPHPAITDKWKSRIARSDSRLKVGISWKGGTLTTGARERSIPLHQWSALFALENIEPVSLQYGPAKDEIEAVNRSLARPILHFDPAEIDDFDDLAGLVSALDVIVSVDTTLVHLCGAIGKPCKVLLPHVAGWRFGLHATRMPWYCSVELYRQKMPGDWTRPFARIAAELAASGVSLEKTISDDGGSKNG